MSAINIRELKEVRTVCSQFSPSYINIGRSHFSSSQIFFKKPPPSNSCCFFLGVSQKRANRTTYRQYHLGSFTWILPSMEPSDANRGDWQGKIREFWKPSEKEPIWQYKNANINSGIVGGIALQKISFEGRISLGKL